MKPLPTSSGHTVRGSCAWSRHLSLDAWEAFNAVGVDPVVAPCVLLPSLQVPFPLAAFGPLLESLLGLHRKRPLDLKFVPCQLGLTWKQLARTEMPVRPVLFIQRLIIYIFTINEAIRKCHRHNAGGII